MLYPSGHVLRCAEAEGQDVLQGVAFVAVTGACHVDHEVIPAEFPHYLAADTAGREEPGNDTVLAAADGDGGEIPVAVVDRLEDGGALGAYGEITSVSWRTES